MATRLELAQMSAAVYGEPLNLAGWVKVDVSRENTVDYHGEAYLNEERGEIVIANRGTRPTSPKDLLNDLKLTLHIATPAQDNAAAFAIQVASNFPGYKITETGHSLGGNNAAAGLVALKDAGFENVSMVTFNAPGIGGFHHDAMSTYDAVNYYARGDMIHLAGGDHLGASVELPAGPPASNNVVFAPLLLLGPIGVLALAAKEIYDVVGPAHSIKTIINHFATGAEAGSASLIHVIDENTFGLEYDGVSVNYVFADNGQIITRANVDFSTDSKDGTARSYRSDSLGSYHVSRENEAEKDGTSFDIGNPQSRASISSAGQDLEVKVHDEDKEITSTIDAEGNFDITLSGTIHGVDSKWEAQVKHEIKGSEVTSRVGIVERALKIGEDGSVEATVGGELSIRLEADHTVQTSSGHFKADGSGTWERKVASENADGFRVETYTVDAKGNITGSGTDRGVDSQGYAWTLAWSIEDGKRYETYTAYDRAGNPHVTETVVEVASDVVEETPGLFYHRQSGLLLNEKGELVRFYGGYQTYVDFDKWGEIRDAELLGLTVHRSDDGGLTVDHVAIDAEGLRLHQWINGDGDRQVQVLNDEGVVDDFRITSEGRVNYWSDRDSAQFNQYGALESFYHEGVGASITSSGVWTAGLENDMQINFAQGYVEYEDGVREQADGNYYIYDGGVVTGSNGGTGTVSHEDEATIRRMENPDGSLTVLTEYKDGTSSEVNYDANGDVTSGFRVTATYRQELVRGADGVLQYTTRFNDGRTSISVDDGEGNSEGTLTNEDGSLSSRWTEHANGTGERYTYTVGKLSSFREALADGSVNGVYYGEGKELHEHIASGGLASYDLGYDGRSFLMQLGSYDRDTLMSTGTVSVLNGGAGNDLLTLNAQHNVILLRAGDGYDTLLSTGADMVDACLSFGNIRAESIMLLRSGSDLTVDAGASASLTIRGWFNGDHAVGELQVITPPLRYDAGPPSEIEGDQVRVFDLEALAAQLEGDDNMYANLRLANYLDTGLSYSGDLAIGGDLAYYHAAGRELFDLLPGAKVGTADIALLVGLTPQAVHHHASLFVDAI